MTLTVLAPSHLQLQARTSWLELNWVIGSWSEVEPHYAITVSRSTRNPKKSILVITSSDHQMVRSRDSSVLFGYCAGEVHGREQNEDVRLKQRNEQMQAEKDDWNADWNQ